MSNVAPLGNTTAALAGAPTGEGRDDGVRQPRGPRDATPRSLTRQAIVDTLGSWGARFGVVWITLLALAAVFAPLLASSHPYLMKVDGAWSSPLLRHLRPADVVLLITTALLTGIAASRRVTAGRGFLFLLASLILSVPLSILFVRPPETIVYEQYRELERAGRVQYLLRAPIPFSANDRLRDQPQARVSAPTWSPAVKRFLHGLLPSLVGPPDPAMVTRVASIPGVHLLGTEGSGGDLLSRMLHASRIALTIGFISQGISVVIGVFVGGLMGYYVGKVDMLGMRVIEIFEAIPALFLLITFAAFFPRNLYLMMAIIGLTSWTGNARFIRGEFLSLRKQDFVQAAIATGLPVRSVIFRHMLPNGLSPVLVSASFGVASAILAESTLSFLGLGLVDEPSWGEMLNQAKQGGVSFSWWIAIFPGLAIFLTVFAYNLIGEAMRDALDPKLRKRD